MAGRKISSRYTHQSAYQGKYPPDWSARRRKVYQRDNWTCQRCGRKSGPHRGSNSPTLHAHHRTPLSVGGSNALSNLTTLCERCHDGEHRGTVTEAPLTFRVLDRLIFGHWHKSRLHKLGYLIVLGLFVAKLLYMFAGGLTEVLLSTY